MIDANVWPRAMHVYTTEGDFACGFLLDRKISAKYEPGGLLKTLYRQRGVAHGMAKDPSLGSVNPVTSPGL